MMSINFLVTSILVIFLSGCNKSTKLNGQEKITADKSSEKNTYCVGRFLIDMPAEVHVFGTTKIKGVYFETKAMSEEAYLHAIDAYEALLKAKESPLGYRFLYEHGEGPEKGTRYFVRLANEGQPGDMHRVVEAYKWDAGYQIKLQIDASDRVNSEYVKKHNGTPYGIPGKLINNVPEKKRLIFDLLRRVEGRSAQIIPTVPGVCFLGGFLPGKAGDRENVFTQFVLRGYRDVSFNIESDTDIQEPITLLERGDSVNAALRLNGGRTIRKGPVALDGMAAEEWLVSGRTVYEIEGHHMTLEANSKTGSAATPLVTLDMDTGAPNNMLQEKIDKASLTDGESVALWDAVSRSLRPRQDAF